jgi:uncharacterized protein
LTKLISGNTIKTNKELVLQDNQNNPEIIQPAVVYNEPVANTIPPRPRPWGPWATIGLGAVIFVVYSLVQALVHLFVSILTLNPQNGFDLEEFIRSLTTNGLGISISTIVAAPVGIFLIIVFAKLRPGLSVSEYLGLRSLSWRSIPVLVLIPIVLAAALSIIGNYVVKPGEPDPMLDAYRNTAWPALFWIAVVIFAPAFEEFLFRGFTFIGLEKSRLRSTGATILTALIWAVLHIQYNWFGMVVILIIGIVLGIVRTRTGSLWATITIHAVWNLLQMIVMVLVINGVIQQ